MTCMIDHWHDLYHTTEPDYINCPYCQDEFVADQGMTLEEFVGIDRLEDQEV